MRFFSIIGGLLMLCFYLKLNEATVRAQNLTARDVWGNATNSLRPRLVLQRFPSDWQVEIDFLFEADYPPHSWLRVTNKVGAKLSLSLSDKPYSSPVSSDAVQAIGLPMKTSVETILQSAPSQNRRSLQWLQTDFGPSKKGESAFSASFSLAHAFSQPITNDVKLKITPLAYKVDKDAAHATLVEFSEIRLNLLKDGTIQVLQ
jgi:hypothetical protein